MAAVEENKGILADINKGLSEILSYIFSSENMKFLSITARAKNATHCYSKEETTFHK